MNNLLSAYFQRLFKSRLYWCLLGLMILSGIIIPILAHREMIAYGTDYTLESRLVWHFLIIGFIVAIFCSWFLGTDYSDGTIRNKIIAGNSRLKIYISALLICVIASVILVLAHQINPVNFKRIEDKDVDQNADVGGVSLIGNKDMKLDRNVLSGNLHIKEGRMITPEDKDMCVISEELAKQNNLKIGDKISFNDYHDTENSKVSEAEIVGIYQVDQKMSPLMQGDTYRSENVIFTDLRFPEKAEGETSPLYERAYFKVEDVEAYDEVKENLQKVDINWEQYDLIDNNGNSETMSSNFNDLAKVSEMMILVISVASFVILVLVFLFWLKNRVQEVGIFLSLGVPKFRIIGQIWSEAIMIAVLSLMLSFAVAPAVSKATANYLVSQQVQQMQEEEKNNEGKVSTEYVAPKQDVQSISVEVTPEMYLLDGVSVLVLITASVLVSGIVILKRNPKDILSEMS